MQEPSCQTLDSNNTGSTSSSRSEQKGNIRTKILTGDQRNGKEVITQGKGTPSRRSQGRSERTGKGAKQLISGIRWKGDCNGRTRPRWIIRGKGEGVCNGRPKAPMNRDQLMRNGIGNGRPRVTTTR